MSVIRYDAEDAIFYFDVQDVAQVLRHLISDHVPEAANLLETISSNPADTDLIPVTSTYFPFIILDLLKGVSTHKGCTRIRTFKRFPVNALTQ